YAQHQQQLAEQQLAETSAALDALNPRLVATRTELQNCKGDHQRLKEERTALKGRLEAALAERRLQAKKQLGELDNAIKQLQLEQQNLLEELETQFQEAWIEALAHWQQVI